MESWIDIGNQVQCFENIFVGKFGGVGFWVEEDEVVVYYFFVFDVIVFGNDFFFGGFVVYECYVGIVLLCGIQCLVGVQCDNMDFDFGCFFEDW